VTFYLIFGKTHIPFPIGVIVALCTFVYCPAVAGFVYFFGYALLAIVTGHRKIQTWLTTSIEVEAAPPGIFCDLKIYSSLNAPAKAFRHSLYDRDDVIKDIGDIVSKLTDS
jgi:hypothetical protein